MSRIVVKQRPSYGGLTAYYTVSYNTYEKYKDNPALLLMLSALEIRL